MIVAKKIYFDLPEFGRVNAVPGGEFQPAGLKNEAKIADTGVVGATQEHMQATASFKIAVTRGLSLSALQSLQNFSITIVSDTGQAWQMSGCYHEEPPKINDGEYDVKLFGMRSEEISAGA